MPVALVGSDMISDGSVLAQMWPYTDMGKALAGEYGNQEGKGTKLLAGEPSALDATLDYLFIVSIIILFLSTWNLFRSNWLSTLLRNARTSLMMESRELERKDAPVPLGNRRLFGYYI